MKIWKCAIPKEVETILQYADPDGVDAELLLPANPALPLLLACRKARDEIMIMSKLILSIVIDDLDMLEAPQFSAYSTRKAIGRTRFTGDYVSHSEQGIDWWSRSEERSRTSIVRHCYTEWKMVYLTLGRNEHVGGIGPFRNNRKAYDIRLEVSDARERPWIFGSDTNESRGLIPDAMSCSLPRCERLGAVRKRLPSIRVQLLQAYLEAWRIARRVEQDG